MNDLAWTQTCLQIKRGGFGLTNIRDTAAAAFTANVMETALAVMEAVPSAVEYFQIINESPQPSDANFDQHIIEEFIEPFRKCKDRINDAGSLQGFIATEKACEMIHERTRTNQYIQKYLSSFMDHERQIDLIDTFHQNRPNHDSARLLSCCGPNSGAWLHVIPKDEHSMMDNEAFRVACNLRLGLPLKGATGFCSLCKSYTDNIGIHPFSCAHQRSRLLDKHNMLVRDIKLLAQLAGKRSIDYNLNLFCSN
jgi:hypothetical protein